MDTNDDLKQLASQLREPKGTAGIKIGELMNETNIKMTLHAIQRLDIIDGDTVLELGHGNGKHLSYLMKVKSNLKYYGLETSELMRQEAEKINQLFVEDKIAFFRHYNGINIPFPAHFFDKIFTVNTIYFWKNPKLLLAELYRITKPNGLVNITFVQKKSMLELPFTQFAFELYDDLKISKLIAKTAFKMIETDTQTETVKSKTGVLVHRAFTTVTLKKAD